MSYKGWVVDVGHYPDRVKPVLALYKGGEYQGHAVFKDEASYGAYCRFMSETQLPKHGTCCDIGDRGDFRCSACLVEWQGAENHDFLFCPSCGARVVEVDG